MTVLELPSWYLPEGGQFVRQQALALRQAGVEVHILACVTLSVRKYGWQAFHLRRYYARPRWTVEDGIPVLRVFMRAIPMMPILTIRLWAQRVLRLYRLYRQRYGDPDLIHVHSGTWGAYAAALIKQRYHVPYLVTEHRGMFGCRCEMARRFFRPEFEPFFRIGLSNADMLLPVSEQLTPKMLSFCTRPVPVRVIGNMVDTDFFRPDSEPRPHRPFRFVTVCSYVPEKGYDILLQAWDIFCDRHKEVQLTMVGGDFDHLPFTDLLARCRHKDRICFPGRLDRDGVRSQLSGADAYVLASRVESYSMATVEGMSMGLPVVGTDVLPAQVLTPDCGIRTAIEDPQALAQAMARLMAHYADYDAAAIRNHAVAIARPEGIAEQLTDAFRKVLSAKRLSK